MTDSIMELDLVVGSLITIHPDEDPEAFDEEQERIAMVQDQLREAGVPANLLSQPGVEVWEGGIESLGALYQLSRLAVHLERDDDIGPVLEDGPVVYDDLDSAVTDIWDDLAPTRFPHLVHLQGIYSHYLPVDFAQPIWLPFKTEEDDEDEYFFGSSVQLEQELTTLADMLHQHNISTQSEAYRCLSVLREAADVSLRHGLPIIVW